MTLFNGHEYLILTIKQEEKAELLDIIKQHNLGIMYPSVFKESSNLSQFTIDDEQFGGHLSNLICWYEYSIIKNTNRGIFKNVKELKEYITVADQRKEPNFLREENNEKYDSYVDSLSNDDLVDEYYLVKSIVSFLNAQYMCTKDFVITLAHRITNNLKRNPSKEDVIHYLSKIRKYIDTLDTALNTELYLINKHNCAREIDLNIPSFESRITYMRMRSYVKLYHGVIYDLDRGVYHRLRSIKNTLTLIFHIFNYAIVAKDHVSFKHDVYQCIRGVGYEDGAPDSIVGTKKGKDWDYSSVLKNLRYSLRFYSNYGSILRNRNSTKTNN